MTTFKTKLKVLTLSLVALTIYSSCSSDDDNSTPTQPETTSYQITIMASPSEGGTVSPQSGQFDKNQQIVLTATPADGWEFIEWQGDVTSTDNPLQITVDATKTLTAVFESLPLFYLADNGVTIMAPLAEVGDTGVVNGITYTKRTADQITADNAETSCTSGITDMSNLFFAESSFNGDISHWDVSSVTNMSRMFYKATSFNGDLSHWDVSSVTNMSLLFYEAESFNKNLSNWNVTNVTNMEAMFRDANHFNQDISNWNVSNVTNMKSMFYNSYIGEDSMFNQDLNNWDVSHVTNMSYMFWNAKVFNGDLSNWDVNNVTNMSYMFNNAIVFNANLSNWNVSNVTDMSSMFNYASTFNQDLTGWCVSIIPSEPNNFASNSALTNENKPVWGTCP